MWCTECGEYFLPDVTYLRAIGMCPHCDKGPLILIAFHSVRGEDHARPTHVV